MYKKIILISLIVFWWWLLTNYIYAEEYLQDDLKYMTVRFCDKIWDMQFKKTIYVEPGKENKVRFCVYNENPTERIPIKYFFNTATYNSVGNRVCNEKTDQWDYNLESIPLKEDNTIMVEPLEKKMIENDIIIPPGVKNWLQMGCLRIEIAWSKTIDMGGMFFLKVSKAFDLDLVIWWTTAIKSSIKLLNTTGWIYSTDKKIKAQVDKDKNLNLWFLIENNGNITQNVSITGKIYNDFGFEKEFVITGQNVWPQIIKVLNTNIWLFPSYKWLFYIKYTVTNDPQFNFDVSDQKFKEKWYITGRANIFMFSWIFVIVIILVILFIYRIIVPRRIKTNKVTT